MAFATVTVNGSSQAQSGIEGSLVELHGMTSQTVTHQSIQALAATLVVQSATGLSKGHYQLKLYDKDEVLADKHTFDTSASAYAVGSNDSYSYGEDISPSFGGAQTNAFNMDPAQFATFRIEIGFAGKIKSKTLNVGHAGGSSAWAITIDGNGTATLTFSGTVS